MTETTVSGTSFLTSPLNNYKPTDKKTVGLPGLGKAATLKLKEKGLDSASEILGCYMMFKRDKYVFLKYLEEEVGVIFVGNKTTTKENIKDTLCNTLEAKCVIISQY